MFYGLRIATLFILSLGLGANAMAYDVYLIRHFEKQSQPDDPALTSEGHWRAKQLVSKLENVDIKHIYSTPYNRTQQTAAPLASRLNVKVKTYSGNALEALSERIKADKVNVLVVGHSNTTPALIALLGGKAKPMSESEYGELFKLHIEDERVETSSERVGLDE